jgi:hypothetical protein
VVVLLWLVLLLLLLMLVLWLVLMLLWLWLWCCRWSNGGVDVCLLGAVLVLVVMIILVIKLSTCVHGSFMVGDSRGCLRPFEHTERSHHTYISHPP